MIGIFKEDSAFTVGQQITSRIYLNMLERIFLVFFLNI
jgi:hypothetical protein